MDHIQEYAKVYNIIPKEECQDIITDCENHDGWQKHSWYGHGNADTKQEKDIYNVLLNGTISSKLKAYISKAIDQYCSEMRTLDRSEIRDWSPVRVNKYDIGSKMIEHTDLLRRHKRDGVPVLTVLGVLNDDFEGGEFLVAGKEITLSQGDIIVFPSTFIYPHEVREITQGSRWSWVTWTY